MTEIDFSAFVQQLGFDPRAAEPRTAEQNAEAASSSYAEENQFTASEVTNGGHEPANIQHALVDGQQGALVPVRRPERPYVRHLQAEVYVTSVKKHQQKPMAYVTFSSPEVAQLVHMTPPSAVGGIPVLPPRQHQSDPNSLVLKWQEGLDISADVIVQDFAAFAAAYTGQGIVTGVKKHAQKSMAFVTFFSPTLAQAVLANPPPTVSGTAVLPARPHQTDVSSIVLKWNDMVDLASDAIAAEFDTYFTSQVGEPLLLRPAPTLTPAAVALPKPAMPMLPGNMAMVRGQVAGNVNMGLAAAGGFMVMPGMMPTGRGVTAMSAPQLPSASLFNAGLAAQLKRSAVGLQTASAAAEFTGGSVATQATGSALQALWSNKRQRFTNVSLGFNG